MTTYLEIYLNSLSSLSPSPLVLFLECLPNKHAEKLKAEKGVVENLLDLVMMQRGHGCQPPFTIYPALALLYSTECVTIFG